MCSRWWLEAVLPHPLPDVHLPAVECRGARRPTGLLLPAPPFPRSGPFLGFEGHAGEAPFLPRSARGSFRVLASTLRPRL